MKSDISTLRKIAVSGRRGKVTFPLPENPLFFVVAKERLFCSTANRCFRSARKWLLRKSSFRPSRKDFSGPPKSTLYGRHGRATFTLSEKLLFPAATFPLSEKLLFQSAAEERLFLSPRNSSNRPARKNEFFALRKNAF